MEKPLNIVLFGPQGSGKGTQAELLSKKYKIPHLVIGDILRKEIKAQTEIGKVAMSYINQGKLVPDQLVNKIVRNEIKKPKYKNGFILDGYPRNLVQLKFLEKLVNLSYIFELAISDKAVISRLSGRLVCENCGAVYHIKNKPPFKKGICDVCGGRLVVREDDRPEVIRRRLTIYHKETEPLLTFYFKKVKLIKINAEQPIEKVFRDVVTELEKTWNKSSSKLKKKLM